MTTIPDEQVALETRTITGWEREGPHRWWTATQGFALFTGPGENLAPLCRFFTESFAPTSTHFYTADAAECDYLKNSPGWVFEGVVGYVWPAWPDGSCGSGGKPLYRLFNRGFGGAPNHRYVTDLAERRYMMERGWIPEGVGPGVSACVPSRPQ